VTPGGPEAVVLAVLDLVRAGRFDELPGRFTPSLRPLVTAEALRVAWDGEVAGLGQVVSVGEPAVDSTNGQVVVVSVPARFERGELVLVVSVTPTGELSGLQLVPGQGSEPPAPWQPPPYVDLDAFDEHDVTLGEGPLAVPGTVTLPLAPGPLPGLVLCGGSGPVDRDSTIGKSKPLRDLAWGLASRGVAVVRFDKVTFAHGDLVKPDRDFTMVDEYVPHALAALRHLRSQPAVAAERVFVAGHSLGGTVAPRIALADPSVAGLVLLAAGAQPMHRAMVRQVRYLAALDPERAAASQSAIDALTAQADRVDSRDLSPDTPDDQLPFGTPAPYWLDLRGYDPVATAAALAQPMFIGQGGRDYQVTTTDDLSRWQAGLHGRRDVTIRVYPDDNHFFFPGLGLSSPSELTTPQHVDPQVVSDIGDWLVNAPASR
jgi:alpha-beta hydrolase superfamily lysophospholipase